MNLKLWCKVARELLLGGGFVDLGARHEEGSQISAPLRRTHGCSLQEYRLTNSARKAGVKERTEKAIVLGGIVSSWGTRGHGRPTPMGSDEFTPPMQPSYASVFINKYVGK